ncbi:MAG: PRC-barrel domain-containing protein [Anaerolineales bacterium]
MDIPINAKVYCQDKMCGTSNAVILNPLNDVVTHLIVKESKRPHTERLVPIDMIDASLTDNIHLKLSETMLQSLPPLYDVEYIQITVPHYMQVSDISYMEPVIVPEKKFIEEKIYHTPVNELAVNRGTLVYSADGYVIGNVDEFLVDQNGGHVTHLILREGHIFGQKDVFIPVAEIETINESSLHLKLDKEKIEKLPAIPVRGLLP